MPSLNPQKPKTWASNRFFFVGCCCFALIKSCLLFFFFRDQNANDCGFTITKLFHEEINLIYYFNVNGKHCLC